MCCRNVFVLGWLLGLKLMLVSVCCVVLNSECYRFGLRLSIIVLLIFVDVSGIWWLMCECILRLCVLGILLMYNMLLLLCMLRWIVLSVVFVSVFRCGCVIVVSGICLSVIVLSLISFGLSR